MSTDTCLDQHLVTFKDLGRIRNERQMQKKVWPSTE